MVSIQADILKQFKLENWIHLERPNSCFSKTIFRTDYAGYGNPSGGAEAEEEAAEESFNHNRKCHVNNGGCDHICTDSWRGAICSCKEGWELDKDGQTCRGK